MISLLALFILSLSSLTTSLKLSSYSFTGPSTQTRNFTIAFQTNSSDPTSINIRLQHETSQEETLASNANSKQRYVLLDQPFSHLAKGEQGRLLLTDPTNLKTLATTAAFKVDEAGNVSAIQSKIPVLTNTASSATPSAGSNGLSTDAKVGISVGVAAVVLLLIGVGVLLFLRERRKRKNAENKFPSPYADPKIEPPGEQKVVVVGFASPTNEFSAKGSSVDRYDGMSVPEYRESTHVELATHGPDTWRSSIDQMVRQGGIIRELESQGTEVQSAADTVRMRSEGQTFELMRHSIRKPRERASNSMSRDRATESTKPHEERNRIKELAGNEYRIEL